MIPMNLMKHKKADYIITGQWAKKAYQEAKKYGEAKAIASSEDKTYSYIPDCSGNHKEASLSFHFFLSSLLIHPYF